MTDGMSEGTRICKEADDKRTMSEDRTEKIMKLGLYMITEKFSKEEVNATMNAIHMIYVTEALSKLKIKKGTDSGSEEP